MKEKITNCVCSPNGNVPSIICFLKLTPWKVGKREMDKAVDIANLRAVLNKVMQSHQLKTEDVKGEWSHVAVPDRGQFHCENCPYVWHSAFSWITFDLINLTIHKKWKMKCKFCLAGCKPNFTIEQLEAMFDKAVRCYKGEKFTPEINIGYSARRNFRQPHLPELCEKCGWGIDRCWKKRFYI